VTDAWAAEVSVDTALASALIAQQFPALAERPVEPFGEGWDNAAFLIGGEYVFRFPRRAVAVALIETEARVLPAIASKLPLPIPIPRFMGRPGAAYPWPFAGYDVLRGDALSAVRLDDGEFERLASECGTFLRALHTIDAASLPPPGLDSDRIGRLDHARRRPKVAERLAELKTAGLLEEIAPFVELLESVAPEGPRSGRLGVVHGNLYSRHILVLVDSVGARSAAGIIDWGDVHLGDPAVDLAVAFSVFPPRSRAAFAAAYGAIDQETWALARYRGVYHSALVAHYGHRIGDADLVRAGLAGLSGCLV
jgi:aminoglycoside phosphotransferase (APT) family kinase protein